MPKIMNSCILCLHERFCVCVHVFFCREIFNLFKQKYLVMCNVHHCIRYFNANNYFIS